jgi:hypothetical protein
MAFVEPCPQPVRRLRDGVRRRHPERVEAERRGAPGERLLQGMPV